MTSFNHFVVLFELEPSHNSHFNFIGTKLYRQLCVIDLYYFAHLARMTIEQIVSVHF